MMHPEPIVLTADEHRRHIESFWRQRDADRLRDEVIFEDDERAMVEAWCEEDFPSEPRPFPKIAARALNCMFWVPVIVLAFEWFRP